jgi:hypothetical protein
MASQTGRTGRRSVAACRYVGEMRGRTLDCPWAGLGPAGVWVAVPEGPGSRASRAAELQRRWPGSAIGVQTWQIPPGICRRPPSWRGPPGSGAHHPCGGAPQCKNVTGGCANLTRIGLSSESAGAARQPGGTAWPLKDGYNGVILGDRTQGAHSLILDTCLHNQVEWCPWLSTRVAAWVIPKVHSCSGSWLVAGLLASREHRKYTTTKPSLQVEMDDVVGLLKSREQNPAEGSQGAGGPSAASSSGSLPVSSAG